ncbi:hypothetical protein [Corynebacterium sp. H130]|uniref:hypothetical protein n=1 Tax=Corynebacterium sp. H130 TaxID=3133444 RepID=UPI0030B291AB
MPNMFPTMYRGDDDRAGHPQTESDPRVEPKALRVGYWWLIVTAGITIFFGLVVATAGYTGDPNVDPRLMAAVEANQRVVGIINIVAGFVLAMLLTQVRRAAKYARRWTVAIILLLVIVDLVAFTVKAAGVGIAIIPLLLTIGALIIYRPAVNRYVAYRNDELFYE